MFKHSANTSPVIRLNDGEIKELGASLKWDRDSLLIRTAFVTGGREIELGRLTKDNVSLCPPAISISDPAKESNPRTIAITEEHARMLLALHTHVLFDICPRRMRYIWHEKRPASIKKPFKALRSTFATELYRKTRDILLVQVALGHKSLFNTLKYAACVEYEESMAKAHVGLDALLRPA